MKVSCIDRYKFEKTHAYFGVELEKNLFEVFSIARFKDNKYYMLKFPDDNFRWFNAELFEVRDVAIPNYWIYKKYRFFSVLKNKKYDFRIPLKEFWGPGEFISNEDFLFDIYENEDRANNFVYEVIKKYY